MTTLADLNKAINHILKSNFPDHSVYAEEVSEGFKRPSFFTQVVPLNFEYDTKNYSKNNLMVVINYFNKDDTALENIKMHDELVNAFEMTLKVNERHFLLQNIRSTIVDETLQFQFDLDFFSHLSQKEAYDVMEELEIKTEQE